MCDFFGKIIITWETIVKHDHHCKCIVTSLHLIESYTYTSYIYNNIHVHSYGYMCCIMGDIFIILKKLLSKEKRHGEIFTTFEKYPKEKNHMYQDGLVWK